MEPDKLGDEQHSGSAKSKVDTYGQEAWGRGELGPDSRPVGAEKGAEIRLPSPFSAPTRDAVGAWDQGSGSREQSAGLAPLLALLPMESQNVPEAVGSGQHLPAVHHSGPGSVRHA